MHPRPDQAADHERSQEWHALTALRAELDAVDPRRHVRTRSEQLERLVIQPICGRVTTLVALLSRIEAITETSDPDVATLCFVARTEVRAALRAVEGQQVPAERLVATDILRTRMVNAIDAVLASADGRGLDLMERADGHAAARVRALYGRFRNTLDEAQARSATDTTQAVATIANAIYALAHHADWNDVRLSDRFVIEGLYRRILEWGGGPRDAGERLLLDAYALGGLLETINRRPSLRRHDAEQAAQALDRLTRGEAPGTLAPQLSLLRGRDRTLDALAERAGGAAAEPDLASQLTARLTQLHAELAGEAARF